MFEHFSPADAVRYDEYARSGVRYRAGAEELLRAAGDLRGLRVADVACGTGLLTAALVSRIGPDGHVLAIDHAGAMLRVARARTRDSRVTFVRCAAESLADVVDEPVDVVCCNAAFWLFDRDRALAAFRRALKPAGSLIFNLSDRALPGGPGAPHGREEQAVLLRRSVLEECLRRARDRYPDRDIPPSYRGPGTSVAALEAQLEDSGFAVRSIELVHLAIPRDEELLWLQIGAWDGEPLGVLAATERTQIFREVFAELPATGIFPARWLTIRADRSTSVDARRHDG
jgi:ubiquinone/menaquinone biosynthesis C-methylase UbiE